MTDQDGLARTVAENLEAVLQHRERMERTLTAHERAAAGIASWIGTTRFAYLQASVVMAWIAWNTVLPLPRFDPYPFVMLAVACSIEAIFLTIFVLVNQRRMGEIQDLRAELDLQIGLLSEREITRVLTIVTAMSRHLDVGETPTDVDDLARDLHPEEVLEQIDAVNGRAPPPPSEG